MPVPAILKGPHKLKTIATQYWDLSMQPRARFFELLAINCDDSLEKEKLIEFSSMEGQEELYSYINRPRRTILEVLQDFPHATSKLSLNFLFEIFQPMKQRPFSIASSVLSNRLDILVAVVEYKTKLKATRKGLCSNFLKTLKPGDKVPALIKNGSFKVPKDEDVPIIMVGPGEFLTDYYLNLNESNLFDLQELVLHRFVECCKNSILLGMETQLKIQDSRYFLAAAMNRRIFTFGTNFIY